MIHWLTVVLRLAVAGLKSRRNLLLENLALRQQILVLQRTGKRPRLDCTDRLLWMGLSQIWTEWKTRLFIVQPDTVIHWHREGFRLFWKWKSRRRMLGCKGIDPELRQLIRQMSRSNPLWGAPRIHGELLKLGFAVSQRTVGKYMVCPRHFRSHTWRTFLRNHLGHMVSIDFFTVPTFTFARLYVFVVLAHSRCKVLHFQIAKVPSATWAAQQLQEAFAFTSPLKYLLRDRDGIYGREFRARAKALGMQEMLIAARSPWQSPYVERLIGSIRRECLDHVIVFNVTHLKALLQEYFDYYHQSRNHLALDKDAPEPRAVQKVEEGRIVALPQVGGLHYRYQRQAAA